jgi:Protein of unknown function (DUF3592)
MDSSDLSKLLEGWTPPEGLNRSWPRPVRLTAQGIALFVLCGLISIGGVAGAVLLVQESRREESEALRMAAQARDTQGVVTRLWHTGGKSEQHRVAYKFTVDGREFEGGEAIGSRYWNSLQTGSAIPVRYLPSDPSHNYPSRNPPTPAPVWLAIFVGAVSVAVSLVLPFKVQRERRLLADGRPAPALVTRLRKRRTQHGPRNIIYYEFPLLGRGTAKGRSNVRRKTIPEGSVICVLYDPDNPRRSAPYPMCLVKLATS